MFGFRWKVNEVDPVAPRYEVPIGDCLLEEPELSRFAEHFEMLCYVFSYHCKTNVSFVALK